MSGIDRGGAAALLNAYLKLLLPIIVRIRAADTQLTCDAFNVYIVYTDVAQHTITVLAHTFLFQSVKSNTKI